MNLQRIEGNLDRNRPGMIVFGLLGREIYVPILIALGGLTLVVLMKDLPALSEAAVGRGMGAGLMARVAALQALPLLTQMMPFAVVIGSQIGLGRLIADKEMLTLGALGLDPRQLVAPMVIHATICAGATLVFTAEATPWAERRLAEAYREMAEINPVAELQPGSVRRFGDWKLLAKEIEAQGRDLRRVLVWVPSLAETVFSETAQITRSDAGVLEIELRDGAMILETRTAARTVHFDRLRADLPATGDALGRTAAPFERMGLSALVTDILGTGGASRSESLQAEISGRFLSPVATLLLGVLAIPLALTRKRSTRAGGAIAGIVVTIAYYGFVQAAEGVAQQRPDWATAAAWLPNVALALLVVALYRRLGRPWPSESITRLVPESVARRGQALRHPFRSRGPGRWILQRYVALRFLQLALGCFFALVTAYLIVDVLERLDWFAKHAASPDEILRFYSARIPLLASRVVPAGLAAAMALTVGLLTAEGELLGMRSLGISAFQACRPALAVCLLITPLSFLLNDQIVPRTNELADVIKTRDIKDRGPKRHAIWNTQGRSLYQLQELDLGLGFAEALVHYELDASGLPTQRIDADLARYEGGGRWKLEGVSAAAIDANGAPRPVTPGTDVDLGESPNEELDLMHLSAREVASMIANRSEAGEATTELEVDLHSKLAAPVACLILPALILAFGVGGMTFPSVPTTFIFAGAVAVLYTLSTGAVTSLGRSGELLPILAGWGTNLLGLVLLASLSRLRTAFARWI